MNFETLYQQTTERYVKRTLASQQKYEKAAQYMTGGETRTVVFFQPYPLTIEKGSGAYLYDLDANRYVDFLNNYTSMIHGHAHPRLLKAAHEAMDQGTCYGAAIPEQIELAQLLCERFPSLQRVRFCNSGTEAVLFAIRAARAFTGKSAIIKMEGGFHGSCDVVEHSVSVIPQKRDSADPWKALPEFRGISPSTSRDVFVAPYNDAGAVERILREKADQIAAIIVEPVLGTSGAIEGNAEYLKRLRELADGCGVLLIFDEIQSSRVAYGGAQERAGVIPDLMSIGKWIGGGFPVAAFGGREDVMRVYDPRLDDTIAQSGTFNGFKVGMAAGAESVKLLDREAVEHINCLGKLLAEGIRQVIEAEGLPISVARSGSMLHIHFTPQVPYDYQSSLGAYKGYNRLLHLMLLNEGVFIAPRGSMNISTVMTEADIRTAVEAYGRVFHEMAPLFSRNA